MYAFFSFFRYIVRKGKGDLNDDDFLNSISTYLFIAYISKALFFY